MEGIIVKEVKVLVTKEVAQVLRLSEEYVRELIRQRKIKAYKEGCRGGFRVTIEEIDKYIARKHIEMDAGISYNSQRTRSRDKFQALKR